MAPKALEVSGRLDLAADAGAATRQRRGSAQRVLAPQRGYRSGRLRQPAPLTLACSVLACMAALAFHPRVQVNPRLAISAWAAIGLLAALIGTVQLAVSRSSRHLCYAFLPIRAHYVQLLMHASIYSYWGWYWPHVYRSWPLIALQILFGYALDMCVCWLRRDKWILGFGMFPIVFSTNLFLTLRDDWFFLQFAVISAAILCKEFARWTRDSRKVHIFNPSAIALSLASIALVATKTTYMTSGEAIANTLRRPPHIYLEIFFLGLMVQALFSVTPVTLSAGAVLYALNVAFTHTTGTYYFFDSGISVSLFLGLHLLITDPATSPRSVIGKLMFGGLYGLGVFGAYAVLGWMGVPQFYDKMLCVPILNLSVRCIERVSEALAAFLSRLTLPNLGARQVNALCMAGWSLVFLSMTTSGFLSIPHPGENPELWRGACEAGRERACRLWTHLLRADCDAGSASKCLEFGEALDSGRLLRKDSVVAAEALIRACNLGSSEGCAKADQFLGDGGESALRNACGRSDGVSCFSLASLYGSGRAVPRDEAASLQFSTRACESGWSPACHQLGDAYAGGHGVPQDAPKGAAYFRAACEGRYGPSCAVLASLYARGNGVPGNPRLARHWSGQACLLGVSSQCKPMEDPN